MTTSIWIHLHKVGWNVLCCSGVHNLSLLILRIHCNIDMNSGIGPSIQELDQVGILLIGGLFLKQFYFLCPFVLEICRISIQFVANFSCMAQNLTICTPRKIYLVTILLDIAKNIIMTTPWFFVIHLMNLLRFQVIFWHHSWGFIQTHQMDLFLGLLL